MSEIKGTINAASNNGVKIVSVVYHPGVSLETRSHFQYFAGFHDAMRTPSTLVSFLHTLYMADFGDGDYYSKK